MLSPSGRMRSGWRGCGAGDAAGADAEKARDSAALDANAEMMIASVSAANCETKRWDNEERFMGAEGWLWDHCYKGRT